MRKRVDDEIALAALAAEARRDADSMDSRATAGRQRAPRGSVEGRYLLKLPAELLKAARRAAKRERVSLAEWFRRAVSDALK